MELDAGAIDFSSCGGIWSLMLVLDSSSCGYMWSLKLMLNSCSCGGNIELEADARFL